MMMERDFARTSVLLRIILYQGEVYRLPRSCQGLRVQSGGAWITYEGRDLVLGRGDKVCLRSGKDFALVSTLDKAPLILEVLGNGGQRLPPILHSTPEPAMGQ